MLPSSSLSSICSSVVDDLLFLRLYKKALEKYSGKLANTLKHTVDKVSTRRRAAYEAQWGWTH